MPKNRKSDITADFNRINATINVNRVNVNYNDYDLEPKEIDKRMAKGYKVQ